MFTDNTKKVLMHNLKHLIDVNAKDKETIKKLEQTLNTMSDNNTSLRTKIIGLVKENGKLQELVKDYKKTIKCLEDENESIKFSERKTTKRLEQ